MSSISKIWIIFGYLFCSCLNAPGQEKKAKTTSPTATQSTQLKAFSGRGNIIIGNKYKHPLTAYLKIYNKKEQERYIYKLGVIKTGSVIVFRGSKIRESQKFTFVDALEKESIYVEDLSWNIQDATALTLLSTLGRKRILRWSLDLSEEKNEHQIKWGVAAFVDADASVNPIPHIEELASCKLGPKKAEARYLNRTFQSESGLAQCGFARITRLRPNHLAQPDSRGSAFQILGNPIKLNNLLGGHFANGDWTLHWDANGKVSVTRNKKTDSYQVVEILGKSITMVHTKTKKQHLWQLRKLGKKMGLKMFGSSAPLLFRISGDQPLK